jgi:hypothetical protein
MVAFDALDFSRLGPRAYFAFLPTQGLNLIDKDLKPPDLRLFGHRKSAVALNIDVLNRVHLDGNA